MIRHLTLTVVGALGATMLAGWAAELLIRGPVRVDEIVALGATATGALIAAWYALTAAALLLVDLALLSRRSLRLAAGLQRAVGRYGAPVLRGAAAVGAGAGLALAATPASAAAVPAAAIQTVSVLSGSGPLLPTDAARVGALPARGPLTSSAPAATPSAGPGAAADDVVPLDLRPGLGAGTEQRGASPADRSASAAGADSAEPAASPTGAATGKPAAPATGAATSAGSTDGPRPPLPGASISVEETGSQHPARSAAHDPPADGGSASDAPARPDMEAPPPGPRPDTEAPPPGPTLWSTVEPSTSPSPAHPSPARTTATEGGPEATAAGDVDPADQRYLVRRGDSLWSITAAHLGPGATAAQIAAEWPRWHTTNRAVLGADPDLIHPGQELLVPEQKDAP